MGRMSDLWKPGSNGEARTHTLEVVPAPEPDHDWFDGADDVPFVEVGASGEPELRLVNGPTEIAVATLPAVQPVIIDRQLDETLVPGLFTVRFRPIVAGVLPGRGFGSELVALHDPDHPISEQYRLLLGEIALQLPSGSPRVLLFTGATAESGTTTVLLNLALTIARTESAKVTVIDANVTRPALADKLGLGSGPGLRDVLAGKTPLRWAFQDTKMKSMRAVTIGRSGLPMSESGWPPLMERLRSEADWVLIDAPVWTKPADAVPLADCCDALYMVVRQADADTATGQGLQQGILETTGRLKGCIITQR
jgi:Mrp family chromosome partitioning ATPase